MEPFPSRQKMRLSLVDQGSTTAQGLKTSQRSPLLGSLVNPSRDPRRRPPLPTPVLGLIKPSADANTPLDKINEQRSTMNFPAESPKHSISLGPQKENAYKRDDRKPTRPYTGNLREAPKANVSSVPHTPPKERPSMATQNYTPRSRSHDIVSPRAQRQAALAWNPSTPTRSRTVGQSSQKLGFSSPTAHGSPSTPTSTPRVSNAEIADIVSRMPRTTIHSDPQSTPDESPQSTLRKRTAYVDTSSRLLADTRGEIEWVKGFGAKRANDFHELDFGEDISEMELHLEDQAFPLENISTSGHYGKAKEIRWISQKDGFEIVLEKNERPVISAKSVSKVSYNIDRRMFHLAPSDSLGSASFGEVLLEIGGSDRSPFRFRSLVEKRFGATKVDKENVGFFEKREHQLQQFRNAAKVLQSPQTSRRVSRELSLSSTGGNDQVSGPRRRQREILNKQSARGSLSRNKKVVQKSQREWPTKAGTHLPSELHIKSPPVIPDTWETIEVRRRPIRKPGNIDPQKEKSRSNSSAADFDEQKEPSRVSIRGGEVPLHRPPPNMDLPRVYRGPKDLPTVSVVIAEKPALNSTRNPSSSGGNQPSSYGNRPSSCGNQPSSCGNQPSSVTNQSSSSVNQSSSVAKQPFSSVNQQLPSGINQSSSPASQVPSAKNNQELRYRSDEVVKLNDLVIRIRDLSDMVDGKNMFDELDVYDGPFQIIELPLSTTVMVDMFSDESGNDGERIGNASSSKAQEPAKPKDLQDEKLVKLEFPVDSRGEPWTKLGRLRPVYRISPSTPPDADARKAYYCSKTTDNTPTVLNTEHPCGIGDANTNQVLGVCKIRNGAYVKVQYIAAEGPAGDNSFEVEKLRGKRFWRHDRVGNFADEKMDDVAILQYLNEGGHIKVDEVLVAKYLVHWAGWPSEDDTWERGQDNIPKEFMKAYNTNAWVRPDGGVEEGYAREAMEIINATSPRHSKKKRKSVSTQAIAVREEQEEALPSPRRKSVGGGKSGV